MVHHLELSGSSHTSSADSFYLLTLHSVNSNIFTILSIEKKHSPPRRALFITAAAIVFNFLFFHPVYHKSTSNPETTDILGNLFSNDGNWSTFRPTYC
jgi:hypothetical protein